MDSLNKTIALNGVSLGDFGIYVSSDTYLNAPSIDYTEYQIPRRIGTVIQYNKRINNVIRTFSCICKKEDYVRNILQLKKLLYLNVGYIKIESDYEQYYQYGYFIDSLEIKPIVHENVAMFTLNFSCNPKKYNETDSFQFAEETKIYKYDDTTTEAKAVKKIVDKYGLEYGFTNDDYFIVANFGRINRIASESNWTISFNEAMFRDSSVRVPNYFPLIYLGGSSNNRFDYVTVVNNGESVSFEYTLSDPSVVPYLFVAIPLKSMIEKNKQNFTANSTIDFNARISNGIVLPFTMSATYLWIHTVDFDSFGGDVVVNYSLDINSELTVEEMSVDSRFIMNDTTEIVIDFNSLFNNTNVVEIIKNGFADEQGIFELFVDLKNNESYIKNGDTTFSFNQFVNIINNIEYEFIDEYFALVFSETNKQVSVDWWRL